MKADRRTAFAPAWQVELDKMTGKRDVGNEGSPTSLKGSRFTERGLFACLPLGLDLDFCHWRLLILLPCQITSRP